MKNIKAIRKNYSNDTDLRFRKRYNKRFPQNRTSHGFKKNLNVPYLQLQSKKKHEQMTDSEFDKLFNEVTEQYDEVFKDLVNR